MSIKHSSVMSEKVATKLNEFLQDHITLQLDLYNYSNLADGLKFNGFSYWLQVQAQDEVLHQRKIMNYLLQREADIKVTDIKVDSTTAKTDKLEEIIHWVYEKKSEFLNKTHELVDLAKSEKDYSTAHFLDWFIEDFCEEIEELKQLQDEFDISNGNYYKWDRHQGKRQEPDTLKVIVPFYQPD